MEREESEEFVKHIEPGSLVLVKDPYLAFTRTVPNKTNPNLTDTIESIRIDNDLAFLVSAVAKEVPCEWYKERVVKRYFVTVLFNGQIYTATVDNAVALVNKFDFLKIPEQASTDDEVESWLNNYYGAKGRIFSVKKDFRARKGDSKEISKFTWYLPDRNDASRSFYVRAGEKVIGVGIRRHAARRVIIFDFFVNGVLCWLEFNTNSKSKSKLFGDFFHAKKGETPYEKELREIERRRWEAKYGPSEGVDDDFDEDWEDIDS